MDNRVPGPIYRLKRGRPNRQEMAAATRTLATSFPLEMAQTIFDNCREEDVGQALSGTAPAWVPDYIRAAVTLFGALLEGPSRDRVLSFVNLPQPRMADVLTHLEFVYATLPSRDPEEIRVLGVPEHPGIDPTLHARMHMRAEGVEGKSDPTKAPLKERDPWNKL